MRIETLRQEDGWRLVRAEDGRCAVVECRAGLVLSLHPRGRREASDTPAGMLEAIGADGWCTLAEAEDRFARMRRAERRLAERIWIKLSSEARSGRRRWRCRPASAAGRRGETRRSRA